VISYGRALYASVYGRILLALAAFTLAVAADAPPNAVVRIHLQPREGASIPPGVVMVRDADRDGPAATIAAPDGQPVVLNRDGSTGVCRSGGAACSAER
jgi:hypothetical protein